MRVEIYWNLHQCCYSVRALEGRHKGRVIAHAARVLVRDARFTVNDAGRRKVLETGRKNVHAFVRGHLEALAGDLVGDAARDTWMEVTAPYWANDRADNDRYASAATDMGQRVVYDPRRFDRFQAADYSQPETRHTPIDGAPMVYLTRSLLKGSKGKRRASMYAFDPCDMVEEV